MKSFRNTVQLVGNLGKEVELRSFDSGTTKAQFSLATNEYYTNNKGEKVEETTWHNIVAWGKTAEIMAKNLTKGQQVLINGKLSNRSYKDKEGNTRYIVEIITNDFLTVKPKNTEPEVAPF